MSLIDGMKSRGEVENDLIEALGISPEVLELAKNCERELSESFSGADYNTEIATMRILKAFQDNRVSDTHFAWNTGYGYNDAGREVLEAVYASYFGAEAALVRTNIVNGTHALATTLLGLLKNGDELIYVTGRPYDTLQSVIGIKGNCENHGTLIESGVVYKEIDLTPDGNFDFDKILESINDRTKIIAVQRSMGYGWRNCITVNQIGELKRRLEIVNKNLILFVDNCYCETLEALEPTHVGADICCGSLIKNPGGGLALSGGYIVGKADLVDKVAYRLTCPGIGAECGLTFGQTRSMLQGLFISPRVSAGAVKAALLLARICEKLGLAVCPRSSDRRSDIIQAVRFDSPDALSEFCRWVQGAAPIDSFVTPVPSDMPGYDDKVIMAAGTFVQGASIELSCDGPLRPPYIAYFQGGLTYEHARIGVMKVVQGLINGGFVRL